MNDRNEPLYEIYPALTRQDVEQLRRDDRLRKTIRDAIFDAFAAQSSAAKYVDESNREEDYLHVDGYFDVDDLATAIVQALRGERS